MALKIVPKKTLTPSVETKVVEYDALRTQKKLIDERMKELSEELKTHAENYGVKDDKGSFYINVHGFQVGKQCKKKVSFNDKAIPFFKKQKLVSAIKLVETIDEKAVEGYIDEGSITYADLESITSTSTSYAIDIKKLEEMGEVEQTTYKVASSKPKTSLKSR